MFSFWNKVSILSKNMIAVLLLTTSQNLRITKEIVKTFTLGQV